MGGVDVSSLVLKESWQVEDEVDVRSICYLDIKDLDCDQVYPRGTRVLITDSDLGVQFAGIVDSDSIGSLSRTTRKHCISLADNHALADVRTVTKGWTGSTLQQIVLDIVSTVLAQEGITATASTVDGAGVTVAECVFNDTKCGEAFTRLKELGDYTWYIDDLLVFYFKEKTATSAPWTITWDDVISFELSNAAPLYRNREIIRNVVDVTSTQTETFLGDGQARSWVLAYPAAIEPVVTVTPSGGSPATKTVGIRGVESGCDFYWNKNDHVLSQDSAGTVLGASDLLTVAYEGFYPVKIVLDSNSGILARRALTGGSGIVEAVDDGADLKSTTGGTQRAQAKLDTYSIDTQQFKFKTQRARPRGRSDRHRRHGRTGHQPDRVHQQDHDLGREGPERPCLHVQRRDDGRPERWRRRTDARPPGP